jgi:hypothetical protein
MNDDGEPFSHQCQPEQNRRSLVNDDPPKKVFPSLTGCSTPALKLCNSPKQFLSRGCLDRGQCWRFGLLGNAWGLDHNDVIGIPRRRVRIVFTRSKGGRVGWTDRIQRQSVHRNGRAGTRAHSVKREGSWSRIYHLTVCFAVFRIVRELRGLAEHNCDFR